MGKHKFRSGTVALSAISVLSLVLGTAAPASAVLGEVEYEAPEVIVGQGEPEESVEEVVEESPKEEVAEPKVEAATDEPTEEPSKEPTKEPTKEHTKEPTKEPVEEPKEVVQSEEPSEEPTTEPTAEASEEPSETPSALPKRMSMAMTQSGVSVGDFVWFDTNYDGYQTAGEPGIAGVTLNIADTNGKPVVGVDGSVVKPVVTDSDGRYSFNGLKDIPAGQNYRINVDATVSKPVLKGLVGTVYKPDNKELNSGTSVDLALGPLTSGMTDSTIDFGFVPGSVYVGDRVWVDNNADGKFGTGDTGLAGVTLTVEGPDGLPVTDTKGVVVKSTKSNSAGSYTFPSLPTLRDGSSYTVRIDKEASKTVLANFIPTAEHVGAADYDSSTWVASSGPLLNNNDNDVTLDFGFIPQKVKVGGVVWSDRVGDGIYKYGEDYNIVGAEVTLRGPDGGSVSDIYGSPVAKQYIKNQNNNNDVRYDFDNLPVLKPGEHYTVEVDKTSAALKDMIPTLEGVGDTQTDSSTWVATSKELVNALDSDLGMSFGFVKPNVSVGDRVWEDSNRNGIQDAGEKGIKDVLVQIRTSTGGSLSDVYARSIVDAKTDTNGNYAFKNLPVLPNGGYYSVSVSPSSKTLLSNHAPTLEGQGSVDEDSTTGASKTRGLNAHGDVDASNDFGYQLNRIYVGDYVWHDTSGDGFVQSGEKGIPDVTLTIADPNGAPVVDVFGAVVGPSTTDANGKYLFSNLPPIPAGKSYRVSVDKEASKEALRIYTPTADRSYANGDGYSATWTDITQADLSTEGTFDTKLDFGFIRKVVSVGDNVWVDSNRDGIKQGSELGLSGVTMTIADPHGNPVLDTLTGKVVAPVKTIGGGAYTFNYLPALNAGESYTVSIDKEASKNILSAYAPSPEGAGTVDTDSSTWSAKTKELTNHLDSDTSLDFGFILQAVEISGYVMWDRNRDGMSDVGDIRLEYVGLNLLGPDGKPAVDVFGNPVGTKTASQSTGLYKFTNLPLLKSGEHYTVVPKDGDTYLRDYVPTIKLADGTPAAYHSGEAVSKSLTNPGDTETNLNLGFVKRSVFVGDRVWADLNRDGLQSAGEPGIPGVVLTLTDSSGNSVSKATPVTTDANGIYKFMEMPVLADGDHYTVSIDKEKSKLVLDKYVPADEVTGNTENDSSTWSANTTELSKPNAADFSVDFGFQLDRISVGDYVWEDTDRDGLQRPAEKGIAGVVLTIEGPNGAPVTNVNGEIVKPVTTKADGSYRFKDLPILGAGESFTVRIDQEESKSVLKSYVPTTEDARYPATNSSTWFANTTVPFTEEGVRDLGVDFGFVKKRVSLGGDIWLDKNRDGSRQPGEVPLSGVTLVLTGPDGNKVTNVYGVEVAPIKTSGNINYLFKDLPVLLDGESYKVTVDREASKTALAPYIPTIDGLGSHDWEVVVDGLTTDGSTSTVNSFGFVVENATVGDFVWNDKNRNGEQEKDEVGIEGVVLNITDIFGMPVIDLDGNVVQPVVTDSNGKYKFSFLPPVRISGAYTVTIDQEASKSVLSKYVPTRQGVGNGNSTADSSTWFSKTGVVLDSQKYTTLDFGFVVPRVSVGDYVWVDGGGDGFQSYGEGGLGGVTLTLEHKDGSSVLDINGNKVKSVTTDAYGRYMFGNLPLLVDGDVYVVRVQEDSVGLKGYIPTKANGGQSSNDSSTWFAESKSLTVNDTTDSTLDFGFVRPRAGVGDKVWVDLNADGIQDASEPGIDNIFMSVKDPSGKVIATTKTAYNGRYMFGYLPLLAEGESYTVTLDKERTGEWRLRDYVPTLEGAGSDPEKQSKTWTAVSKSLTQNGTGDTALDFGFIWTGVEEEKPKAIDPTLPEPPIEPTKPGETPEPPLPPASKPGAVSVGDRVWLDKDGDGIQDELEASIGGVVVDLYTSGGDFLYTDITDAAGKYLFEGLPVLSEDDYYVVKINQTESAVALEGLVPTLANQGTNREDDSSTWEEKTKGLNEDKNEDLSIDFGFDPGREPVEPVDPTAPPTDPTHPTKDTVDPTEPTIPTSTPTDPTDPVDPESDRVSVGDRVWDDANGNGRYDAGEEGIGGVVLRVKDSNGIIVGTSSTDMQGHYKVAGMKVPVNGDVYTVFIDKVASETALKNYKPTTAGIGDKEGDSSDWEAVATGLTQDGAVDTSLDFGFLFTNETTEPVDPTEPTTPTDSTEGPTTPTEPVNPTDDPTSNPTEPTNPPETPNPTDSTEPTDSTGTPPVGPTDPVNPTDDPTGNPSQPTGDPTGPTSNPSQPTGDPTDTTGNPTDPANPTDDSTSNPTDPVNPTDDPTGNPTEPVNPTDDPTGNPSQPTGDPTDPTGNPTEPVNPTDDPTGSPSEPTGTTTDPVLPTDDVTGTPTDPVTPTDSTTGTPTDPVSPTDDTTGKPTDPVAPTDDTTGTPTDPTSPSDTDGSSEPVETGVPSEIPTTSPTGPVDVKDGVSAGDWIWVDANKNGRQDKDEAGLKGIVVDLKAPDGKVVLSATTGGDGEFIFKGISALPKGEDYVVEINRKKSSMVLKNFSPTKSGKGDKAKDSSTWSEVTEGLHLAGALDTTIDFGFVPKATLVDPTDPTDSTVGHKDPDGNPSNPSGDPEDKNDGPSNPKNPNKPGKPTSPVDPLENTPAGPVPVRTPTTPTDNGRPELPETGAESLIVFWVGSLMLLSGMFLSALSARQRRKKRKH